MTQPDTSRRPAERHLGLHQPLAVDLAHPETAVFPYGPERAHISPAAAGMFPDFVSRVAQRGALSAYTQESDLYHPDFREAVGLPRYCELPREEQQVVLAARVGEAIRYAQEHSPWYTQQLKGYEYTGLESLANFPLMSRGDLRELAHADSPLLTVPSGDRLGGNYAAKSSGSTGRPKELFRNNDEVNAYHYQAAEWLNGLFPAGTRFINLVPSGRRWDGPKDEVECLQEAGYHHVWTYGNSPFFDVLKDFSQWKPTVIFGIPDFVMEFAHNVEVVRDIKARSGLNPTRTEIEQLLRIYGFSNKHIQFNSGRRQGATVDVQAAWDEEVRPQWEATVTQNLDVPPVDYVIFGGMPLSETARQTLGRTIGRNGDIQTVGWYSGSEAMLTGLRLPDHQVYHLTDNLAYVEIRDPETGQRVPDGDFGEVVVWVTHLTTQPTLGFQTGDMGRIVPEGCGCPNCKLASPAFELAGRTDDMVMIHDHKWPVSMLFEELSAILTERGTNPLAGVFQLEMSGDTTTDTWTLRVDANDPEEAKRQITKETLAAALNRVHDRTLSMHPEEWYVDSMGFKLEVYPQGQIPTQDGRGKVRRLIDNRTRQ